AAQAAADQIDDQIRKLASGDVPSLASARPGRQTSSAGRAVHCSGFGDLTDRFLFVVEDRFQITGRGLCLFPDAPDELFRDRPSGFYATVRLERPDGSVASAEAHLGGEFLVLSRKTVEAALAEGRRPKTHRYS